MWLRTRDSHRAQFPCHGAQPGKGQPGHGIVWYLMELCGIVCFYVKLYINVWYCMVLHSHGGPVSLPWGTSKQGSARAWEGKRLSLSLQICALCCTSNGVYIHRAISCVSTKLQTPNPNCAWSSIIVGCGFYHVLCDPRTYRYTVHLRVRLLMDQLYPGSWFPLHRPHPLLCLPGSSRVVGASNLNAFCPFLQERRVRAKSWIF